MNDTLGSDSGWQRHETAWGGTPLSGTHQDVTARDSPPEGPQRGTSQTKDDVRDSLGRRLCLGKAPQSIVVARVEDLTSPTSVQADRGSSADVVVQDALPIDRRGPLACVPVNIHVDPTRRGPVRDSRRQRTSLGGGGGGRTGREGFVGGHGSFRTYEADLVGQPDLPSPARRPWACPSSRLVRVLAGLLPGVGAGVRDDVPLTAEARGGRVADPRSAVDTSPEGKRCPVVTATTASLCDTSFVSSQTLAHHPSPDPRRRRKTAPHVPGGWDGVGQKTTEEVSRGPDRGAGRPVIETCGASGRLGVVTSRSNLGEPVRPVRRPRSRRSAPRGSRPYDVTWV